jgi:hypothetical protein
MVICTKGLNIFPQRKNISIGLSWKELAKLPECTIDWSTWVSEAESRFLRRST